MVRRLWPILTDTRKPRPSKARCLLVRVIRGGDSFVFEFVHACRFRDRRHGQPPDVANVGGAGDRRNTLAK